MYGNMTIHNDAAKLEAAQASRRAVEAWRFRQHKGATGRVLAAAWAGVRRLARREVDIREPAIASAHGRLSYRA